jgi:anti-sigma regulatory factor (Ser/Thr protein kinase)
VLSVELPPEPASATRARRLARDQLAVACTPDVLDTVSVLVTELVTNAILHARTPLRLVVESHPDHVRLCVEDASPQRPEVHRYGTDAVTGRGLALVEQLASSWGVEGTPTGKIVWCTIAT